MADPSRTASVGDGLDGLKRVGLPASAHHRPTLQTQLQQQAEQVELLTEQYAHIAANYKTLAELLAQA